VQLEITEQKCFLAQVTKRMRRLKRNQTNPVHMDAQAWMFTKQHTEKTEFLLHSSAVSVPLEDCLCPL